jgi:hypothetical protein
MLLQQKASKRLVVVRALGIDTLCQNLNKKSEFKRFLAEMSKNKQSRYARKVVRTIHEEGFIVFARKAFRFSRRTVLRRIELKLLSNFYIWGIPPSLLLFQCMDKNQLFWSSRRKMPS